MFVDYYKIKGYFQELKILNIFNVKQLSANCKQVYDESILKLRKENKIPIYIHKRHINFSYNFFIFNAPKYYQTTSTTLAFFQAYL